jgi:hypothetical protein
MLNSPPAPIKTPTPATIVRQPAPTGPVTPVPTGPATPVAARVPGSAALKGAVTLRYLERSPILVHGPATGRQYNFSADNPLQSVDRRDAAALVRTRFFRLD